MTGLPTFEFHVSREARDRYRFSDSLFTLTGRVVFAHLAASREFAHRINEVRKADQNPEKAVYPGALYAMGLIHEALHRIIALYRERQDPAVMRDGLDWFQQRLGREALDRTILAFADNFPAMSVYRGEQTSEEWLKGSTGSTPNREIALEELVLLWLANANPAYKPASELFEDAQLRDKTHYTNVISGLREYFDTRPKFGRSKQNLVDVLRAPALASPDSLAGQLAFLREEWGSELGDFFTRLLTALDVLKEEELAIWYRFHPPTEKFGTGFMQGDSGVAAIPHFSATEHEYERFSTDVEWMPKTVLMAKTVYVWLDQLSKQYQHNIYRLDHVPDEELNTLARRGFNALWLIGLWERSKASKRIKQLMGKQDAVASAYSLHDYTIAADLGGEEAYINLRDRAAARGIRLASDMVPNHMGIDSRWMIEHPDWFLALRHSPYPSYSFNGPDLSDDGRVEIKVEDHYYDKTDAAVVFRRVDRWSGDTRFIYHGNDGTSFPWNDTAQLNYLKAEVREGVIQTILHVARLFPIIRFDAAMTLAKRHYQRLWFPEPGTGGAIPSRAEYGMSKPEFDAAMPVEFWRELVDRVQAEVPGTLLLAEAFWLMEGYFVRTLGMHRVYNSAFMNMMRDEENANYRSVIKNTLEFDPDVLKRYVNFMNNPDERTAVDQFGKGDKYFGVCTLMATLPGLPMFGHGQIEGYTEKYGMEYRRAYYDESPDQWLVARHEREISPLLHRRALFAEVQNFLLYDFYTDGGWVNEDVYAYSNRLGNERALVVYNNRYADTAGWIRVSTGFAEKQPDGGRHVKQRSLGESFNLSRDGDMYLAFRDALNGLEYLHRSADIAERGIRVQLGAYKTHVFLDWRDIRDDGARPWGELCNELAGNGVSSLEDSLRRLEVKPVREAIFALLDNRRIEKFALAADDSKKTSPAIAEFLEPLRRLLTEAHRYSMRPAAEVSGLGPALKWNGDIDAAIENFTGLLSAVARIPELEKSFDHSWPEDALEVLPSKRGEASHQAAIWGTAVTWCALQALGEYLDPRNPERAGAMLFDSIKLREPIGDALQTLGLEGEVRWRAAARIRALLAHSSWAPGAEIEARRNPDEMSWLHDPDVAWLIGVHEHEGERYIVKEAFEQTLWWASLRRLAEIAGLREPDPEQLHALEDQLSDRFEAARRAGYKVGVLLSPPRAAQPRIPPLQDIKKV